MDEPGILGGGQARRDQDHQLKQPALEVYPRSEHLLQLERVFTELGIAQPHGKGSAHMAAGTHDLIVDLALLRREVGFIYVEQTSHLLSKFKLFKSFKPFKFSPIYSRP